MQYLYRLACVAIALGWLGLAGCDQKSDAPTPQSPQQSAAQSPDAAAPADSVELIFSYGSEKQKWIDDVTGDFNNQHKTLAGGKVIRVRAIPGGSGETMEDLLAGRVKAHVWSPASGLFIKLANARSAVKGAPLVGTTQDLVLSPVVIALWRPMAEALGWPEKPIGWSDIIALANDPRGWGAFGHPEFGAFKLGHTHPQFSNSGLISILAETYAGAGKVRGLNSEDLNSPQVSQYLDDIEKSIVHYGRSTGFFGRRLAADGPQYLSAAVLYENMVVESYSPGTPTPLVAIYPKEGTFWSDHPIGIVQREWVDAEHRDAAQAYIDFLRAPPQQAKALAYGFRPAEGDIGAPIDAAHGVDPHQPSTILELPSADTIDRIVALWKKHKKPASVVVVFDRSGSMEENQKIYHARDGALTLLSMLDDNDQFGLVPFSSTITVFPPEPLSKGRQRMIERINAISPGGQTNLFEATLAARNLLAASAAGNRIRAVVVLTDGEDNGTRVSLGQLLEKVRISGQQGDIRIFTIGYGDSARLDDLQKISDQTKGEFYKGDTQNIRQRFEDIATFF